MVDPIIMVEPITMMNPMSMLDPLLMVDKIPISAIPIVYYGALAFDAGP